MSVDSARPHFIPTRWKPIVEEHIFRTRGVQSKSLSASDFLPGSCVQLRFEDNSVAIYRHAFCLHSKQLGEVAVFTEHCGYYFYLQEIVVVEQMQRVQEG